jgi:3',5'-cyclic AMP phosphodiesterase CpdA
MRTIAHISDLHFGRTEASLLDPLRDCLVALDPDLLVVSGDLTQRARAKQFEEARDYLETLPKPQIIVPGNHDVPLYNVYQRFLQPLAKYRRLITDDLQPAYIDDEIAVVGVNTARRFVFKGGRINEDQVEKVRSAICGLPEEVTKIIVSHHPFDVPRDSTEEDQIVGRARMALEKLADCGADVLLAGHLHASHIGHTANRYAIAGVSALVVQAGTALSNRQRGEANSFNLLRVESLRIEVDRYEFHGGTFARAQTEAFHHDGHGWSPSA